MAKFKVNGEAPFQVLSHSFGISESNEGYTLNYSADGIDWTEWSEGTPANETCYVNFIPYGAYFKLAGNNSEVTIIY